MSDQSILYSLLAGVQFEDPRLYDLLSKFIGEFYRLDYQINPPISGRSVSIAAITPGDLTTFTATIYPNNVRLSWASVAGINSYEIRYKLGLASPSDWDVSTVILRTGTTSADINPLTIPLTFGDHTFLIKAINTSGTESTNALVVSINVPIIQGPIINASTINNFVLLSWTTPSSAFTIEYYNIYKDGVFRGRVSGTFEVIFESNGGTYTYTVIPVDIVGNVGTVSAGAVVSVSNPADYTLHASLTSTFGGTPTNCKVENVAGISKLLACIDTVKSFQDHFDDNSWASPQEQIDAGYPIYIEPAETTGNYVEVFDFGSIVNNVIVSLTWNIIPIVGTVTVGTSTIEVSTDGSTYSAPVTGSTTFATAVRYVRFTMNFVGSNDKSLAYFYNLQCLLNVRYEQDAGVADVLAADAGGTVVNFTKSFKSISGLTVTPVATTEQKAIYDFSFPVNPTSFKVLLFNAAGARINGTVSWVARGII